MNRHAARFLLILALAPCLTGCATNYMKNRWHDTKDIVTLTLGFGAGIKAHAGPVGTGNIFGLDLAGLRGGDMVWGAGRVVDAGDIDVDGDLYLFPLGAEKFTGQGDSKRRGKAYVIFAALWLCIPLVEADSATTPTPVVIPLGQKQNTPEDEGIRLHYPSLTQIEAAAGFGPMVRVGFNVGELVDLVLGLTTLDMYSDDIAGKPEPPAPGNAAPPPAPAAASPAPAEPAPQDAKAPI